MALPTRPLDSNLPKIKAADPQTMAATQPPSENPLCEDFEQPRESDLHLLRLPLKIRVMIYECILFANPFRRGQGVHVGVDQASRQVIYAECGEPEVDPIKTETRPDTKGHVMIRRDRVPTVSAMFLPFRPQGFIPSAVLTTCRQIYLEARSMPFNKNDFDFGSLGRLETGFRAASLFMKSLVPWQRSEMRWVRLDVKHADCRSLERLLMCEELCSFWGG